MTYICSSGAFPGVKQAEAPTSRIDVMPNKAKQGQPNDQTHDILGRQLAPPDRDLARVLKNVLNNYWIDQIAESA